MNGAFLKRAFDVAFSLGALVCFSPVLAVCAAAIKATSPGPVFFRQERVGRDGRRFTLYKLRTMRSDCDPSIHEKYTAQWIAGKSGDGKSGDGNGVHKLMDDPRVTPVGRLLRRSGLDEIPQFFNVLKGDMSVVGPRPPLPYEVERYTDWHRRRLQVLPGITGLWQVSGRNSLSFDDMVRLDIEYIENWSLALDMKIVLRTVPAMIMSEGY